MINPASAVTGAEISLVIPICNEAATLPQLLATIAAQRVAPRELLVVDSGSTDGSVALVEQWAEQSGYGKQRCRVITNPGGMPGANRNLGVAVATGEWIAFLDGGIAPEPDWLAHLCDCVSATGSRAVFGQCRFDADSVFGKAVCALSNGCGSVSPVLPASLFHHSVFKCVGGFREDLRSAEDILWLREVERHYGSRVVCEKAMVHYRHFPTNVSAAVNKWWLYEQNSVRARVRGGQQWLLTVFFAVLLLSFLMSPWIGVALLFTYLILRGVIDPMRRSGRVLWWGEQPLAIPIALALGVVLDGAKTLGGLVARLRRMREGRHAV